MKNRAKQLCVVGGGPSGIVAYKELKEAGFDVQCYEKSNSIGGVFSEDGNKSFYTVLNISKFFIAYSDCPPVDRNVCPWTWKEYNRYLERYARENNLSIQCRKKVKSIHRVNGKYAVAITDLEKNTSRTKVFDYVVVCAGLHHTPRPLPFSVEDQQVFNVIDLTEESLHSMKNKNVLLFGLGESTADVIKVLPETNKLIVVSKRKRCFGGNIIKKYPPDLSVSRVWQTLPRFIYRIVDHCISRFSSDKVEKQVAKLSCNSNLTCTSDFLVKNSGFAEGLLYKNLLVKNEIAGIRGKQVAFTDREKHEIDFIVNCTGFDKKIPSLVIDGKEVGTINFRTLYKHMFMPSVGPSLSFVGYAKPTLGNIPATSEMQARYMAMLLNGEIQLPDHVHAEISKDAKYYGKHLATDNDQLVHYMKYLDSLAEQIGCKPNFYKLIQYMDFRLIWHCLMGSHNPLQYRLFGPDANYVRSRNIMLSLPVTTSKIHLPLYFMIETGKGLSTLLRKLRSVFTQRLRHQL